jgi:hypothetical protein
MGQVRVAAATVCRRSTRLGAHLKIKLSLVGTNRERLTSAFAFPPFAKYAKGGAASVLLLPAKLYAAVTLVLLTSRGAANGLPEFDFFRRFDLLMRLSYEHVDRRNDEQSECGADNHAAYQHDADAVSGSRAWACCKNQWKVPKHRGSRGHQDRTQPRAGGAGDRFELAQARLLQVVGEFYD